MKTRYDKIKYWFGCKVDISFNGAWQKALSCFLCCFSQLNIDYNSFLPPPAYCQTGRNSAGEKFAKANGTAGGVESCKCLRVLKSKIKKIGDVELCSCWVKQHGKVQDKKRRILLDFSVR